MEDIDYCATEPADPNDLTELALKDIALVAKQAVAFLRGLLVDGPGSAIDGDCRFCYGGSSSDVEYHDDDCYYRKVVAFLVTLAPAGEGE